MFGIKAIVRKIIASLFLVAVLSTFVFAYLHIKGMAMSEIALPGCPFMDMDTSAICTMSPLEHIEAWQHLLTVTPATSSLLLILLALLVGKRTVQRLLRIIRNIPAVLKHQLTLILVVVFSPSYRYRLNDFYLTLFSRGILHPKVF